MEKRIPARRARTRRPGFRPEPPRFTQSELWESLEPPVEVPDAIRTLAALRERFEQALAIERARA
jgi:hypothetical protein